MGPFLILVRPIVREGTVEGEAVRRAAEEPGDEGDPRGAGAGVHMHVGPAPASSRCHKEGATQQERNPFAEGLGRCGEFPPHRRQSPFTERDHKNETRTGDLSHRWSTEVGCVANRLRRPSVGCVR